MFENLYELKIYLHRKKSPIQTLANPPNDDNKPM